MTEEMLEVVDENDNVIGIASRKEIHARGLLHREIHVLFVTPAGDIIFQKRSMSKDTNPGCLTVTVGGHVSIGDSYELTALREAAEETGLKLDKTSLIPIEKTFVRTFNRDTNIKHLSYRMVYGHIFEGSMDELRVEKGESDGYVSIPIQKMLSLNEDEKLQFTPSLTDLNIYGPIYEKLQALITK